MNLNLQTVRDTLRWSLGRESFIASFIKQVDPVDCPTAQITKEGHLQYNPQFVKEHVTTKQELFCLIVHELMHPMFGHFIYEGGQLENLAADMVINAGISQVFSRPSGNGLLFRKFYAPEGLPGLLRPESRMGNSRYGNLYTAFYSNSPSRAKSLSTGEVIQSLKVLTPSEAKQDIVLLGNHGNSSESDKHPSQLPQDTLSNVAEDLRRVVKSQSKEAGYSEHIWEQFLDVLNNQIQLKRAILDRFVTKQKLENFLSSAKRPRVSVSPIPLQPSKRDLVLLAASIPPLHYHRHTQEWHEKKQSLAVYLDVSGSVNEYLPKIVGMLQDLRETLTSIFLFSNQVVEIPFKKLLQGHITTTYGTDFDCIAESILERELERAIIVTDGYASLKEDLKQALEAKKLMTLTVLFGGKSDCPEFAETGDVLQLNDVVNH